MLFTDFWFCFISWQLFIILRQISPIRLSLKQSLKWWSMSDNHKITCHNISNPFPWMVAYKFQPDNKKNHNLSGYIYIYIYIYIYTSFLFKEPLVKKKKGDFYLSLYQIGILSEYAKRKYICNTLKFWPTYYIYMGSEYCWCISYFRTIINLEYNKKTLNVIYTNDQERIFIIVYYSTQHHKLHDWWLGLRTNASLFTRGSH